MLIVSILAFFVLTFLLASIVVAISWMAFLKTRAEETEAEQGELSAADESGPLIRTERLSTINFWDNVLARFDFMEILRIRIAQADLDWSVGRVTIAMALAGAIAFVIFYRFLGFWPAAAASILAAIAPYGYILHLRNKRFRKFAENFPDVLDSLSRALRAGYPLSASMDMIAGETVPPVSTEMRKTAAEANLGVGWTRALENLGQRVPLLEVNLFISAVALHSRTGGKLSDVMSGLAENMRESIALQGEIRSLAAHGKLTGLILTILPIVIALMMMYVSPGYMEVLYHHPYGKNLITAAVVCLILAHFVIRKIVDIKV
ncbi:MAG: type II secretion system F family protein [Bryobacteraceae bacterium]